MQLSDEPKKNQEPKDSEEPTPPSVFRVKPSVARKVIEGIPLPDDVKNAVKQLAQAQGKSEQEVLQELVTKGLASSNEELMYMLARKKVLNSITLDEAELMMKKVSSVFSTWSTTPHPNPSLQPTQQQIEQKDEFTQTMDKIEKDVMKGLPPVTYAPQSNNPNPTKDQSIGTVMLYNLGKYALGLLLKNEQIGKAISKLIEEKGGDFLSELEKMFKEGEKEE